MITNIPTDKMRVSYESKYAQVVVLTLQTGKDFEKGRFLREMGKVLGDYEIKSYSQFDGKANITLVSRGINLTENGTSRETAEADILRIKKLAEEFGKLENALFESYPSEIRRVLCLK